MIMAALLVFSGNAYAGDAWKQAVVDSKKMVKEMGMGLKSALKEAIKNSGPAEAIYVCRSIAPQKAAEISEKHGASIRRVSLKLRNPSNAPDRVEKKILTQMEKDHAAGALRPAYIAIETGADGARRLRFLKPIVTGKVCLNCHGPKGSLAPGVAEALEKNYPGDMATGYTVNQVRGAFSVSYPID